jgi:HEAT repeat protein
MITMNQLVTYRPHIRFGLALLAVAVVATAFTITQRAYGYDQEIAKLNRFVQAKGNTASMQIFREGRDFIEAQNWQRAAEKFNDFITAYPKDKELDAALYWYGYALQKQDRKEEAAVPLLRLIRVFPNSTWRREADALLVVLGRKAEVDQALARDNCEIKMLALQSLFQADQEKAIAIASEALRANPGQCQNFQAAAVSLLGSHGGARAVPILLEIARSNPDQRLRLTAIKRLGDQHTDQVTDDLIKIYDADRTKEIRAQILRALVESRTQRGTAKVMEIARQGDSPELRMEAIRRLGDQGRIALDDLLQLYTSETNPQIKQGLLRAFANNDDPRARTKLLEIARGNDPIELRGYAIRQLGEKDDEQTVNQLIAMYDSEQNTQLRMLLIRAFGDSKQKTAVRKLMTIARNDSSVELRKVAVRYLGESKDPEALKFLEDLLK